MSTLLKNLKPQLASILKLLQKTPKNVPGLYFVISVVHKKERNRRLIALQLSSISSRSSLIYVYGSYTPTIKIITSQIQ